MYFTLKAIQRIEHEIFRRSSISKFEKFQAVNDEMFDISMKQEFG